MWFAKASFLSSLFLLILTALVQEPFIHSLDSLSGRLIKTIRSQEGESSYLTTETDSTGKIQVEFFTADVPVTYKVLINGITVHVDIIHKDFTFSIKNN